MRVTFGMHVGAWLGPGSRSHLGEPVLGRLEFLGLLETHLGLGGPPVSAARRAAAYLVALRSVDTPQRFYHRSLEADEIGTAAQLLRWRDEWFLAGWNGQGHEGWPARLADLAAVEGIAARKLPPGEGERLAAVALRLRTRRAPVDSVALLDPLESFPARWRDVLALLPTQPVRLAVAVAAGDLGRAQTACIQALAETKLPEVVDLAHDGSIRVLRPLGCEVAEHWLADHCRRTPNASRLIVAEERGAAVDDTFRVQGLPACGFDEPSTLRPALQALPLALETLWDPVEPARLLEFLSHPIGPIHGQARRLLAEAFAKQPGVGGQTWANARERIAVELGADVIEQVAFWLEGERSPRGTGAPLEQATSRVTRLREALQTRMGSLQQEGGREELLRDVAGAVGQCTQLLEGLQELRAEGLATVRPRLLEQLTAHATADSGNTLVIAEVGCMQAATAPAACAVESVDEVIWWMPAKPRLPAPLPWVGAELQALAQAGLQLREPAAEMAGLMAEWLRPLLAARHRLIMVLPPEGSEQHPAWQLISAVFPGLQPVDLDAYAHAQGQPVEIAHNPLPRASGAWQLDPQAAWRAVYATPTRLHEQSYTSLNLLFNNPAVAVLSDAARLMPGVMLAVDERRLQGNLAHRLLERLFAHEGSLQWTEADVDGWIWPALDDLMRREGLPLLAPGSAMRLQQFRDALRRGILVLLQHLRHARAVRVQAERSLKGSLGGLDTIGDTDLLVHLEDGGTAALDLKWATASRYRERLEQGDFLQLALYALMIEQELGKPPAAVGFFTFLDATLLTLTPGVFAAPLARVIRSSANPAQLIQSAMATWEWRVGQWQDGLVEVVGEGLDPPASTPPPGCLPLRALGPWHGDYEALFGLREDA